MESLENVLPNPDSSPEQVTLDMSEALTMETGEATHIIDSLETLDPVQSAPPILMMENTESVNNLENYESINKMANEQSINSLNNTESTENLEPVENVEILANMDSTATLESAPTVDMMDTALTTGTMETAPTTDTMESARTTDMMESARTTDMMESALTTDTMESALAADTMESALAADTMESALTTDTMESALTTDTMESALTTDTMESALTTDTMESALTTDTMETGQFADSLDTSQVSSQDLSSQQTVDSIDSTQTSDETPSHELLPSQDVMNDISASQPQVTAEQEAEAARKLEEENKILALEKKKATELEKYWKAVRDNPTDFTGWTYLLQYVEQESALEKAREAFDEFLSRYPYCYGYWKKYSDLEKKNNKLEHAQQVLEKGVAAIPLSIDLWLHYINFAKKDLFQDDANREDKIMQLYERGVAVAGTDFRADKLWDSYTTWEEKDRKNLVNVTQIYDRLLAIPTQLYNHNYECFCEHVHAHSPRDILTLDEFLKLRQEVIKSKSPDTEATEEAGTEAPPGDDSPPGDDPEDGKKKALEDAAELTAIREKVIQIRKDIYQVTEQEVSRRWAFEEGIRRPYFHVKPLEKIQLKNWKDYLDMEIERGVHERTVVLFERCLIACALYEEFWLKYACYLETSHLGDVREVYRRGCTVFLTSKPNIHLAWAAFEEKQGNFEGAEEVLERLEATVPRLAMVRLRHLSVVRRRGQFEKVDSLYGKYIEDAETDEDRGFYSIKRARYQAKTLNSIESARMTIEAAIEKDKMNAKLYLQLVDLEYQRANLDEMKLTGVFDKAIQSDLDIDHRILFSQRKLEFLEDFSSNIARVQEAAEEYKTLQKETTSTLVSKKRKPVETTPAEPMQIEKKPKIDSKSVSNGSADYSQTSYSQQSGYDYNMTPSSGYYSQGWNQGYNQPYNYQQNQWAPYSNQYYPS